MWVLGTKKACTNRHATWAAQLTAYTVTHGSDGDQNAGGWLFYASVSDSGWLPISSAELGSAAMFNHVWLTSKVNSGEMRERDFPFREDAGQSQRLLIM